MRSFTYCKIARLARSLEPRRAAAPVGPESSWPGPLTSTPYLTSMHSLISAVTGSMATNPGDEEA